MVVDDWIVVEDASWGNGGVRVVVVVAVWCMESRSGVMYLLRVLDMGDWLGLPADEAGRWCPETEGNMLLLVSIETGLLKF